MSAQDDIDILFVIDDSVAIDQRAGQPDRPAAGVRLHRGRLLRIRRDRDTCTDEQMLRVVITRAAPPPADAWRFMRCKPL